jgi:hypothetical protein
MHVYDVRVPASWAWEATTSLTVQELFQAHLVCRYLLHSAVK